ncbi:MAG TPA: ATP-binding cassette domain-containing protein, partial [Thermoanaerobaculia bacterium]|nr:ATP-binding cassette domain-containing protein [Thermoanaerobaculia bacterium]
MLELRGITKRFGEVLANDGVDVRIEPGTVHALVGENGAGKSTAMRIAYGFYTADAGEVRVDGEARTIAHPRAAIALGIGMVHQQLMLINAMTVAENVVLGDEPGSPWALDLAGAAARIRALSAELGLAVDPRARVESLSIGERQRVELVKALYRGSR